MTDFGGEKKRGTQLILDPLLLQIVTAQTDNTEK